MSTWRSQLWFSSLVLFAARLLTPGRCSLVLELQERSTSTVTLSVEGGTQPRPLDLVLGHTYHIMCRDTANTRQFDDPDRGVWSHNESVVQRLSPDAFPGEEENAVYASTGVSMLANEWTLVLQLLRRGDVGLYTCAGLEGQSVSLEIGQAALSVVAGKSRHTLTAGPLLSNGVISLSPFISSSSAPTVVWLFNGESYPSGFSPGVAVLGLGLGSEVILRSPIVGGMRGNYTCRVQSAGATSSAVYIVQVNVAPNIVISPPSLSNETAFAGGRLIVLCEDREGFPLADVIWYRNGTVLTNQDQRVTVTSADSAVSTLVIDPVLSLDVGAYSCNTSNIVAASQRTFQLVKILELHPRLERLVWMSGETLTLQIRVEWDPRHARRLQWQWSKDGSLLTPGTLPRATVTARKDGDSLLVELKVGGATVGDSGVYACQVSSSLGVKVVEFDRLTVNVTSVLFQLRLLEIGNCQEWVNTDTLQKTISITSTVVAGVNQYCPSCDITTNHITLARFLCFPSSPEEVIFRAHLLGTEHTSSDKLLDYVRTWLQADGTALTGVVLVSVDKSCRLVILSLNDPECDSNSTTLSPPGQSGVPLVLVIGVSAGMGVLLLVVVVVGVVVVTTTVVVVMSRSRKVQTMESKREESPRPTLSAVNPSLTGGGWHGNAVEVGEPYYEDIDKYKEEEKSYEKMASVHMNIHDPTVLEYDYAAL